MLYQNILPQTSKTIGLMITIKIYLLDTFPHNLLVVIFSNSLLIVERLETELYFLDNSFLTLNLLQELKGQDKVVKGGSVSTEVKRGIKNIIILQTVICIRHGLGMQQGGIEGRGVRDPPLKWINRVSEH